MPKFTDSGGRQWTISISLGLQKRVKEDADFDLFEAKDHAELAIDPVRIGEVMYSILEPQILENGLTPEEFADGFDADTIEKAASTLHEALVSFFQKASPAKGKVLAATLSKTDEMLEKSSSRVVERLDSPKLNKLFENEIEDADKEFYKVLDQILQEKSSKWPELQE